MYLKVMAGQVTLEDATNFRSFKVVVAAPEASLATVRDTLATFATVVDRDTAWISEEALREWPGCLGDPGWQEALSAMIEKARPHGWIDDVNRRIKAHIEWPA
jgi:hypothetical protein